jgi:hypothetical protein
MSGISARLGTGSNEQDCYPGVGTIMAPAGLHRSAAPLVERTFAWLSHNRRTSNDYERLCSIGVRLRYDDSPCKAVGPFPIVFGPYLRLR